MATFIPRHVFPTLDSLPRSYFLGHHRAGLAKMKTMLSYIDLVIECRDYRVPLTSRNPLFEENLAGRERLIVYTKQDLGSEGKSQDRAVGLQHLLSLLSTGRCKAFPCSNYIRRGKPSSKTGNVPPLYYSRTTETNPQCAKCSISHKPMLQRKTP